jgi:hypothetical protein
VLSKGIGLKNIRIRNWDEFKRLVNENKPKSIVYIIAESIPAHDFTSLKLLLPKKDAQYIFIDTSKGEKLRRTGIQVHAYSKNHRFLTDEDVKNFLRTHFKWSDLNIYSYWTA